MLSGEFGGPRQRPCWRKMFDRNNRISTLFIGQAGNQPAFLMMKRSFLASFKLRFRLTRLEMT
jgi:hypothetical protein